MPACAQHTAPRQSAPNGRGAESLCPALYPRSGSCRTQALLTTPIKVRTRTPHTGGGEGAMDLTQAEIKTLMEQARREERIAR